MNTASAQNSHPQPGKCTSADPQKDPLQGHKIHKGSEQLQSGHDNPSQGASRREVLVFRHLAFEDLGTWEETFSQLGFCVAYVDMGADPLDENRVMNAALLIVLGGPIGVHDKELYPFLADEESTIKRRMSQESPIIGICLGAQLMALAAGGAVKPAGSGLGGSPGAMEIGFSPLNVTEDG
ncbi:MAG: gamma-glutamyl-gamma-aminobutyrate hydrolase family protein, partial [Corynebacterium kroppenstedtii]|nr:gamma-glutamyl-gamma-aminobutyrate hydrolase family protein [Corynebacterium kroppenstedtii]